MVAPVNDIKSLDRVGVNSNFVNFPNRELLSWKPTMQVNEHLAFALTAHNHTYIARGFGIANRFHNRIACQNFPFDLRFEFVATDGSKVSHRIFGRNGFTCNQCQKC